MEEFTVIFYDKANGAEPAKDFPNALDKKVMAKMARMISMLQENGPELREPYSKPVGDGIFELRAKIGSDISRVLYFFYVGRTIVLTNGFIKKTQKTALAEIDRARKYRREYLARKGQYQ